MSFNSNGNDELWNRLVKSVDRFLLPIALGICSFVVPVQLICTIPTVRTVVDRMSERFVPVSTSQAAVTPVHLSLYVSPGDSRPDIQVYVNGMLRTAFVKSHIAVDVYPGDKITILSTTKQVADVSFDSDTVNLLYPVPGYTVTVGDKFQKVTLDKVQVLS